ncbi:ABC transporter ATP-binding protein [Desulfurococcus mucosus]|uniref:Molybdate/tungstate import ATP-binding protein WtpC n=1 Tax=Desulfurococcus mucosus (strain ATCC 35584 / DSM 2162 / JCM 9187 / O7/1) TaxID=765177 RepID=E8R8K4_DESM0|nr:ABC transporter ATP-binding protein [Desulfurococcus mucosus]ADV64830.1 ABC transporter related protein [Desulfurococcus mucosus DSM 2162]
MVLLEARGVSKSYNDRKILDDVSFHIDQGELCVILGPPGSGKTTLLKIIAGLVRQDEGSILLNGESIDDKPPSQRPVSMMFETLALYSHLTVYENIASPLIAAKKTPEEIDRRVRELAGVLKIEHLLERKADKLSGGERQRVAMARALAKDASIYLLDEPFANLDAKIRHALRTEFKKLKQALGKTIVLATSDPLDALSLGDKIIVIRWGKVYQVGDPLTIYRRPKGLWLSRYLTGGLLNELEVAWRGGELVVEGINRMRLSLPRELLELILGRGIEKATLASYIDGCSISRSSRGCKGLGIKAKYIGAEYRGSEYIVYASEADRIFKCLMHPAEFTLMDLKYGDEVEVCIDLSNTIVFAGSDSEEEDDSGLG